MDLPSPGKIGWSEDSDVTLVYGPLRQVPSRLEVAEPLGREGVDLIVEDMPHAALNRAASAGSAGGIARRGGSERLRSYLPGWGSWLPYRRLQEPHPARPIRRLLDRVERPVRQVDALWYVLGAGHERLVESALVENVRQDGAVLAV